MSDLFDRLERTGFVGLQGSAATLRLAVDEALINELIADTIVPQYPALRELRVEVEADNLVRVRVRSSALLVPEVSLQLEIERVAVLKPAPRLRFRIRKQGFSKIVASLLPMIAHRLPPHVRLSGEIVEIDLAMLLGRWQTVLALLVGLEIETSPKQLHVSLELRA